MLPLADFNSAVVILRACGNLNATYKPYQGITIPNRVGNDDLSQPTIRKKNVIYIDFYKINYPSG